MSSRGKICKKTQNLKSVKTGFSKLDESLNGGFFAENLYVFAAASGIGKTLISQKFMQNAMEDDIGVLFISMEMAKKAIFARFLSLLSGINAFRISINNIFHFETEKFDVAFKKWQTFKDRIFITEKSKMSAKEIEYAIKRAKRKRSLGFVVVDYAQIMKLREKTQFSEASLIKENVAQLASLAKKYNVAILLLCQLTKEKVAGKIGLSSLKGSGGLYEDADVVLAMYQDGENQGTIKELVIDIIKNRHGQMTETKITLNEKTSEFQQSNNF